MSTAISTLYAERIQPLPPGERLELLALIAQDLAPEFGGRKKHSLEELRGLGKEIWEGEDAQEYVNRLRQEWEEPPC